MISERQNVFKSLETLQKKMKHPFPHQPKLNNFASRKRNNAKESLQQNYENFQSIDDYPRLAVCFWLSQVFLLYTGIWDNRICMGHLLPFKIVWLLTILQRRLDGWRCSHSRRHCALRLWSMETTTVEVGGPWLLDKELHQAAGWIKCTACWIVWRLPAWVCMESSRISKTGRDTSRTAGP